MIINFSNLGGGGGGGYVLPVATDSRLGGVKVGSGLTISNEGVLSADGGSDYLPKIDTLPETAEDGAVYNYKGVLVKYVNGSGNWAEWVSMPDAFSVAEKTSISFNIFTYPVDIPASMDGQILYKGNSLGSTGSNDVTFKFDLQNNRIGVLTATTSTEYDMYVEKDGAEVSVPFNSYTSQNLLVSWSGNVIKFSQQNTGSSYSRWYSNGQCPVSTSTAHYEFFEPVDFKNLYTVNGINKTVLFDSKGNATPGMSVSKATFKLNGTYTYYLKKSDDTSISDIYAPTTSGVTGTLCVSQGNNAPQFKTIAQALGVDFAVLTQDEYDALDPNNGGTGYTSTRLYFIKDE